MSPLNVVLPLERAVALYQAGRLEEAERVCREIVAAQPGHAGAWQELGRIVLRRGQPVAARGYFEKSLELAPGEVLFHLNNVLALMMMGEQEAAREAGVRTVEKWPGDARALLMVAKASYMTGRAEEAIALYERVLAVEPNNVDALADLGKAHRHHHCNWKTARKYYEQVLALDPKHEDTHLNYSYILLVHGELERGFEEYEWRWRSKEAQRKRHAGKPAWAGQDLAGKTIVLYAEQGLGDTIQFFRYVPLLAARGAKVVVECQGALKSLLTRCAAVAAVREAGEALPGFDYQLPLASVPRVMKTTLATIPAAAPYLEADGKKVKNWGERMAAEETRNGEWGIEGSGDRGNGGRPRRVGLCWAGNPAHAQDKERSIPLAMLAPLGAVGGAGVVFYSLQKGPAAKEAEKEVGATGMRLIDKTNSLATFDDTAALVANLDLVITVDTAVAHLAGALNKPVWNMVHYPPDWRWMFDRTDTPWYPSMRLFRQTHETHGDWGRVVGEVAEALAQWMREGH